MIDDHARMLIAGSGGDRRIEGLLEEMDGILADLDRTAAHIVSSSLKAAIERTVSAHTRWSRARMGSHEERTAAAAYLETVDALAATARSAGKR